ncbi:MAG: TonB-dependent receptor [Saprospiraceae bacterium]
MRNFLPYLVSTVLLLLSFPLLLSSQTISGSIKDQAGNPVSAVQIHAKGSKRMAQSDAEGKFTYTFAETDQKILQMSKDGFLALEYALSPDQSGEPISLVIIAGTNLSAEVLDPTNIPVVELGSDDITNEASSSQDISGLLHASRDIFLANATFNLSAGRYRIRGYNSEYSSIYMNGLPVNDLEAGQVYWNEWGGLNDVMRNRENTAGLFPAQFGYGDIGGAANIDVRASKQRKETRFSYGSANRNYRHRLMATHSTGMMSNGWAFTGSVSRRWAQEGYVPGTFYDAFAYFLGVERRINEKHSIGLTVFGAPIKRGMATSSVQEMYDLAGTNYYNPNWGFQGGEKRNARVASTHQPIIMLRHDWAIKKNSALTLGASFQFGRNGSTAIDWYQAKDPRPDYYSRLPSYVQDSATAASVADILRTDEASRQIDWTSMYNTNYNSYGTYVQNGDTVTARRAQYVIEERRNDSREFNINALWNQTIGSRLQLQSGATYRYYRGHNFKVLTDLLGADYTVDIDKFAESDIQDNPLAKENDLQHPGRILKVGDSFGYNYNAHVRTMEAFQQAIFKLRKWDLNAAAKINYNQFWREGLYQNGRFPDNSLGDSEKLDFLTYSVKAGVTYKINGRNYAFVNGLIGTRAPLFRNVYIAARTRDQVIANPVAEQNTAAEAGYVFRSPLLKLQATGYYTKFDHQTDVVSFYDDELVGNSEAGFVNYVITDLQKTHTGLELAAEYKLSSMFTLQAAAGIGDYIYSARPQASIYQDNYLDPLVAKRTIYLKNYYLANTPQQAYTGGLRIQGKQFWFININANYYAKMYLDPNPNRRTVEAVQGVEPGSELFHSIIDETKLQDAFTLDLFGGKSWKFGKYFIYFNLGINNILNNKDFVTGGFEQLRFDFDGFNVNKFAPRKFYAYGINYFASLAFKF